jgi:ABC-type sugar transport system ATPase subunit
MAARPAEVHAPMEVHRPGTPVPTQPSCILQALGMHKQFGAVVALSGASLELQRGEIMGLVGDNGAGKSTLVKILAGSVVPDSGRLVVDDKEAAFRRPSDALATGIETVYQDLSLIEPLSAYGNIFLGRETLRDGTSSRILRLLDSRSMRHKAREVLDELGARIPSIDSPVQDLSGGQRQSLAIARALLFGRQIVILDEPTAALGVRETEHVLEMIRRLNNSGISIIVVSHNIEQLLRYADRVTVLRLGQTVGVRVVSQTTPAEVVSLITGLTRADPTLNGHKE